MKSSTPQQIKDKKYALSYSDEFNDMMELNVQYQMDKGVYNSNLESEFSSHYGKKV